MCAAQARREFLSFETQEDALHASSKLESEHHWTTTHDCIGTLVTSNIVHSRAIVSLGTDARLSKIAGFLKPEPGQDG